MEYNHEPVLLQEVLEFLKPQSGEKFIDGTLGGGGYSLAILDAVGKKGQLLAIDLDQPALENFKKKLTEQHLETQVTVVHGNFSQLGKIARHHSFGSPNGVVLDLGLSSFHLDSSKRGFSFQKHEILDMRFDETGDHVDAKFILNSYTQNQLTHIFREFGEEHFAPFIARAIVRKRAEKPFQYTTELVECIQGALPKPVAHKYKDSCRRIFQALRIAVNRELEVLEDALEAALDVVAPGGRIVVVSFHSLEDRIVKQFFVKNTKGCICPLEFPICQCGKNPRLKLLTKKPVVASDSEQERNPRSKSAKLRAVIKL